MGSIWRAVREKNVIFGKCRPPKKQGSLFWLLPQKLKKEKRWALGRCGKKHPGLLSSLALCSKWNNSNKSLVNKRSQCKKQSFYKQVPFWGPAYDSRVKFFFFLLGPHLWHTEVPRLGRGQIRAVAAGLHHSHSNTIQATSATYTMAHSNTRSLTH